MLVEESLAGADYEGIAMPYVNIKITKEGATSYQKAQLIKGVTRLLVEVLGRRRKCSSAHCCSFSLVLW